MGRHVHECVLDVANRIAQESKDGAFSPDEIVRALPQLNESTVRTHVVSRCCVNAPKNHLHKWPYFRRVAYGKYQVEPDFRQSPQGRASKSKTSSGGPAHQSRFRHPRRSLRDTIHAIIQKDDQAFVAECLELAVVTQGRTLDEVVENFRQAVALHLDGEDMAALGLADDPRVQLIYDTSLAS
jgi:predicted RNase H-like HicB family nuclease